MSLLSLPGEMRRETIGSVNFFHKYGLFLGVLVAVMSVQAKDLPKAVKTDFQKSILPLFKQYCFNCHGEEKPKAGIRVDYLDGTVPDKEVRHWEIIRKQLIELSLIHI